MKMCGIYVIKHLESGKVYVGQSVDIHRRWRQHRNTKPQNSACMLHTDLAKYGRDAFVLEVLKECAPDELTKWEQHFLDELKPFDPEIGYNLLRVAGFNPRGRRSEAFRKACSDRLKGKPCPISARVAMSERKRQTGCHQGERNGSYGRVKAPHEIAGQRLKQPNRVIVIRRATDGSEKQYSSLRYAASAHSIDRRNLTRAIKEGREIKGYIWFRKGEEK
jgi:group I intron endonuclease